MINERYSIKVFRRYYVGLGYDKKATSMLSTPTVSNMTYGQISSLDDPKCCGWVDAVLAKAYLLIGRRGPPLMMLDDGNDGA